MTRTKQHNHMATVTGRRPVIEAESKAKKAYEKAEAEWLATSRAHDNSRAAELGLQKLGLHNLWREECAKAKADCEERRWQWEAEIEAEAAA
jgi:hypothetical protein